MQGVCALLLCVEESFAVGGGERFPQLQTLGTFRMSSHRSKGANHFPSSSTAPMCSESQFYFSRCRTKRANRRHGTWWLRKKDLGVDSATFHPLLIGIQERSGLCAISIGRLLSQNKLKLITLHHVGNRRVFPRSHFLAINSPSWWWTFQRNQAKSPEAAG